MDGIKLLNQVKSQENIELAFRYALSDRTTNDSYFDHFEIEYVKQYQETIISEILEELKSPSSFKARVAYAYYMPKNNLCYRRMIYLPFKDLVIRYAFVIVLANYLDISLSERCFANRKATGKRAEQFLLEDYYNVSLANFRNWQKECSDKYQVLIRTDISSFYDSVSHQYLIKTLAEQLSMDVNNDFLQLFEKLLCPDIISYSHKTEKIQNPQTLRQGLIIGNNLEGFLANLYLREIDEVMEDAGIEFGRYNDDMRIFAENRQKAHLYLLILQEHLLSKGLNLNASKTIIAENREEIEKLRTKLYDESSAWLYDSYSEIQDTEYGKVLGRENELDKHIDKELALDDIFTDFNPNDEIKEDKEAKNFCKYMHNYLAKQDRKPEHINKLQIILTHWQGSSKHAAWLLVQSTYDRNIAKEIKSHALDILFKVLSSNQALSYTKYRLLHHLVNLKNDKYNGQYRLIDRLEDKRKQELKQILVELLQKTAFELKITALYALKQLEYSQSELEKYVNKYIPKPLGYPILNAISYTSELEHLVKLKSSQNSELAYYEAEESDEFY